MTKKIEITNLRVLSMSLVFTPRQCIIVEYAEETASGRCVDFGKAVFWTEFPAHKGPYANWYLIDPKDNDQVGVVAAKLGEFLRQEILGAAAERLEINLSVDKVEPGESVICVAFASDKYGGEWEVTPLTTFSIDPEAGGSWNGNVYTSENVGQWEIVGLYEELEAIAKLKVYKES